MIANDDETLGRSALRVLLFAGAAALASGLSEFGIEEMRGYLKRRRKVPKKQEGA